MKKQNDASAEPFFLENFNTDAIFRSVERQDYIFLYYIKQCAGLSDRDEKVYLSDLSEMMHLDIPAVSDAVERLHEKGFLAWETDTELGKTYVMLTSKAVELMADELRRMKKCYAMIRKEIGDEEFEHTLLTLRKITGIIKRVGEPE